MESIPKKYFSRKEELIYPQDVAERSQVPTSSPPSEGVIDKNVERHLYGSIQFCEGGEVFEAGDYC